MSAIASVTSAAPAATSRGALDERTAHELLRLTRLMVTAAHADDWDAVTLHDTTRRELLASAPEAAPGIILPATLTEALIAADQAVLARVRQVRDTAVDDTHKVRAERDARNTYAQVMGEHGQERG